MLHNETEIAGRSSLSQAPSTGVSAEAIRRRVYELEVDRLLVAVRRLIAEKNQELVRDFFANHLFMPPDRAARDRALEEVHAKMANVSVLDLSKNLGESVELARLSTSLDSTLVAILRAGRYASATEIGAQALDSAVREENRGADRRRMVELLVSNIRFFHKLSHAPFAGIVASSLSVVARATRVACLVDQIDAGYRTARAIRDIDAFLAAVRTQEMRRLDQLLPQNRTSDRSRTELRP